MSLPLPFPYSVSYLDPNRRPRRAEPRRILTGDERHWELLGRESEARAASKRAREARAAAAAKLAPAPSYDVDMDWHAQTPPSYCPPTTTGKRTRAEFEEDQEEDTEGEPDAEAQITHGRTKKLCWGIVHYAAGFSTGLIRSDFPRTLGRPGLSGRTGRGVGLAVSVVTSTTVSATAQLTEYVARSVASYASYHIVRIYREALRSFRHYRRTNWPAPKLTRVPFARAAYKPQRWRLQEATPFGFRFQTFSPEPDAWIDIYPQYEANRVEGQRVRSELESLHDRVPWNSDWFKKSAVTPFTPAVVKRISEHRLSERSSALVFNTQQKILPAEQPFRYTPSRYPPHTRGHSALERERRYIPNSRRRALNKQGRQVELDKLPRILDNSPANAIPSTPTPLTPLPSTPTPLTPLPLTPKVDSPLHELIPLSVQADTTCRLLFEIQIREAAQLRRKLNQTSKSVKKKQDYFLKFTKSSRVLKRPSAKNRKERARCPSPKPAALELAQARAEIALQNISEGTDEVHGPVPEGDFFTESLIEELSLTAPATTDENPYEALIHHSTQDQSFPTIVEDPDETVIATKLQEQSSTLVPDSSAIETSAITLEDTAETTVTPIQEQPSHLLPSVFDDMPRLAPPRESSPKRVKTPIQNNTKTPIPCKSLRFPFPNIHPLATAHGRTPSPPNDPSAQLLGELNETHSDNESEISASLEMTWIPTPRNKALIAKDEDETPEPKQTIQPTAAQPITGENAEGSSTPTASKPSLVDNTRVRTPASRRVQFDARTYQDTPESEISSTCDFTPGSTPRFKSPTGDRVQIEGQVDLETNASETTPTITTTQGQVTDPETPTADRVQIDGQSHADNTKSDTSSTTFDASPGPTPKFEVTKFETPVTRSTSSKLKTPETRFSDISSNYDTTPRPSRNEHDIASDSPAFSALSNLLTPKAVRHSSEKVGRITRAQAKAIELRDDRHKYTIGQLSKDQERKVEDALQKGTGKLSASDLARVVPKDGRGTQAWLNDEAVNAYLELVVKHGNAADNDTVPSHHFFNSFFYTNLSKKGPDSIKRWVKKAKIDGEKLLKPKFVFIPINSGAHWTLAVVSGQQKTITHYNSLPGSGSRHLSLVQDWVKSELGSAWSGEDWRLLQGESPQQANSDDCGVFTVTNARMLMLGMEGGFAAGDIPLQRRRMVAELVEGALLKGVE